jgi:hypothetical protein
MKAAIHFDIVGRALTVGLQRMEAGKLLVAEVTLPHT